MPILRFKSADGLEATQEVAQGYAITRRVHRVCMFTPSAQVAPELEPEGQSPFSIRTYEVRHYSDDGGASYYEMKSESQGPEWRSLRTTPKTYGRHLVAIDRGSFLEPDIEWAFFDGNWARYANRVDGTPLSQDAGNDKIIAWLDRIPPVSQALKV